MEEGESGSVACMAEGHTPPTVHWRWIGPEMGVGGGGWGGRNGGKGDNGGGSSGGGEMGSDDGSSGGYHEYINDEDDYPDLALQPHPSSSFSSSSFQSLPSSPFSSFPLFPSSSSSSSSFSLPNDVRDEGGVLRLEGVGGGSGGWYMCVATNNQGSTNTTILVRVVGRIQLI